MQHPDQGGATLPALTLGQMDKLAGLKPESWAAHALLDLPLTMGEVNRNFQRIPSTVLYPLAPNQPPAVARLVVVDLGKRAYKVATVTDQSKFLTSIIPDAYVPVTGTLQHEGDGNDEDSEKPVYAHCVFEERSGEESEVFQMGESALRLADLLPTDEDSHVRLADPRSRNMVFAAVAEQYALMKLDETVEHNTLLCLGVPPRDLDGERAQETKDAATTLKGRVTVEQTNLKTGARTIWTLNVIGVYVEVQTRGTFYSIAKKIDGAAALTQKLFEVYDLGGGDTNKLQINAGGVVLTMGERIGNGTIEIARALRKRVEEDYGIELSEIAAQEALHTKKIWRGGAERDISATITKLLPRFQQILTRVTVSRQALSTFLVFTGGGSALFHEAISSMIQTKSKELVSGEDYLIVPADIAPIANAIGLYALCYFKIQAQIKKAILEFLALGDQLTAAQANLEAVQENAGNENRPAAAVRRLHEQHSAHVGNSYPPSLVRHIAAQRKATIQAAAKGRPAK